MLGVAPATPTPNVTLGGGTLSFTNSFTTSALSNTREIALATPVAGTTADTINVSSGQRVVMLAPVIDATGSTGAPFVKGSTGNLTLVGANTYTGNTTVSAGTLLIDGTAVSPTVTVSSGATLAGQGSITSNVVTTSGSILSPGSPLAYAGTHVATPGGNFTIGSLSMAAGSIYNYDLESTANDLITVTGAAGVTGGGGVFNLYQSGTATAVDAGTYDLMAFTGGGTFTGDLTSLSLGNFAAGTYTFEIDPSNSDLAVVVSVPEPVSVGLLGLAAMAGLTRRRRDK